MPFKEFGYIVLVFYIIPMAATVLIVSGASTYINFIPNENRITVIGAFLTASSILFGFAALSFRHFSDRILGLNQKASDIAKEFCDVYKMAKADKKLSSMKLSYKTKIGDYGRRSAFGYSGDALETISSAYDFTSNTFRWWVSLYKNLIYFFHVAALLLLGASIIFSLLSYSPSLMNYTLLYAIMSFMLSIPTILIGWYFSDKNLIVLDDTLFNVRQQIISGVAGILRAH
jgi:hypothetical protein